MTVDEKKLDTALAKIFAHGPGKKRPAKAKKSRKSAKRKPPKRLER
ncbi:MAG TPA: hypothetical protein VFV07_10015 [Rhizomicrobium sp.]|nr:hypothetical protein [Rhizomicrobium sp.]